jgi:hypothetical protein
MARQMLHAKDAMVSGPAPKLGDAYQARPLRFIRRQDLGDWRLKVYGIAMPGKTPRAELVEATIARAEKVLPDIGPDRPGIGFVIAHDAAAIGIALIYWWAAANELHQRVFTSPIERPAALEPVPHPAAGCVWELGIIDFERRAWIEDVLKKGDVELYLGRELRTEV